MRDYGKVHTSFWTSKTVRDMTEDGRTLAFYLLSTPHGTIAGVARIPDGYACEDLQWTAERVRASFAELKRYGFAERCEETGWVWIRQHFDWNPLDNPNQRKSARKVADQVPSACVWLQAFHAQCGHFFGLDAAPPRNPSETVSGTLSQPFRNQEQEQEQEKTSYVPGDAEDAAPAGKAKAKAKATSFAQEATEILIYLNGKAGRSYKPVPANLSLIAGRLHEGATVDECKAVVDAKVTEWRDDVKMRTYLRPATLFNATKFASYVGELGGGPGGKPPKREWL